MTYGLCGTTRRLKALAHEFLGELYTETGEYEVAANHLQEAYEITEQILPKSDVMTEVRRRQADLCFRQGRYGESRTNALKCINISKKMGDRYELGAALRILGEYYQVMGQEKKAIACFETAIKTLKGIHECYELMRGCIAYGAFLVEKKNPDAEIYLMDGRQLCKKLELDYYLAKIDVLLGKYAADQDNFAEARDYLAEAEKIYETLQPCDQKQLKSLIKETNEIVDRKILRRSMTAAEELKTICRVYEEARFPIEDIKPDLAYQVAQSVGAEGIFLIRRHGKGYRVPLTYNVSVNEAKEMVRRFDRNTKQPLLGIKNDARILPLPYKDKSLVCIPCLGTSGFIMCTLVGDQSTISPRQYEFLFASAEALERLAEDDGAERPVIEDDFLVEEQDSENAKKHPRGCFKKILTIDPGMIKLIRLAERASLSDASILLEGETGVGKELFAKAIHENSRRKEYPFIAINAGGMPVNFLESQLFGHVKGAYTDAVNDRIGLIEEARGGSVFFDEIGEMSEELQVKLLRLLENGEFRRLGENKVRIADIRMVSATNRNLLKQVERGEFRKDLYYRLGAVKLSIPPLRFRTRDIELLIRNFLKESALKNRQLHRHFQIDVKAMPTAQAFPNRREGNRSSRTIRLAGKHSRITKRNHEDSIINR